MLITPLPTDASSPAATHRNEYPSIIEMRLIPWLLMGLILLSFCGVVYFAFLSWRTTSPRRRIAGTLLLAPHFLLIVCIVVSLLCGKAPQGSRSFNTAFFCDVLIVFILPLPALVGTVVAFTMFKRAPIGP